MLELLEVEQDVVIDFIDGASIRFSPKKTDAIWYNPAEVKAIVFLKGGDEGEGEED